MQTQQQQCAHEWQVGLVLKTCLKICLLAIYNKRVSINSQIQSKTIHPVSSIMNQISQLPMQAVIKSLADSVAVQFHQLSKKCVSFMKKKLENDQTQRLKRRQALLAKFKAKQTQLQQQQQRISIQPIPAPPPAEKPASASQQPQGEESRLARINRIKEAMLTKKIELELPNEVQKEEKEEQDIMKIAFHNFSEDLRPQILGKYPSAQPEKVNKVILQKWTTFDPAKKQAYIKKIKKKLQLNNKKKQQADNKLQNPHEVKREEIADQHHQPKISQTSNSPLIAINTLKNQLRLQTIQERNPNVQSDSFAEKEQKGDEYKAVEGGTVMNQETEISHCTQNQSERKQKYEMNVEQTS